MNCKKCQSLAVKNGRVKSNRVQRYFCNNCRVSFVEDYVYNACQYSINSDIVTLVKEGCGTRSISRILGISATTVTKRIIQIAASIRKPPIPIGKTFELDELRTFVGSKKRQVYLAYAIDRATRFPVDFVIGNRTTKTQSIY